MDILKNLSVSTKILISVGAILGLALSVIALETTTGVRPLKVSSLSPMGPGSSKASPVAPAPTRENVSKRVEEQIAHLKAVVAKNPSDARSAIDLARTLQDGHNLKDALKYYEIGLKADPRSIDARVDYSFCLYQSGKEQEALTQSAIILRWDATNPHALFNLGSIYANRGQGDSARFYWKSLISAHPRDELAKKADEYLKQLTVGGAPAM